MKVGTFKDTLTQNRVLVEARILQTVRASAGDIGQAMSYAAIGGKGLRGFLVVQGAQLHGVSRPAAIDVAAAIECLHAYSLVHDDLPCMDDDAMRRGLPTVHVKWDEATAVLAGDALQALAFELVAGADCTDAAKVDLVFSLSQAAGITGMVGGQALDIAAETAPAPLTLQEIIDLQAGKTGALITWSACAGARMAGADISALKAYGDALGLAFQIWDDVLDVEGDADTMGKAVGKDAGRGKATFVSHLGLDGAKRRANDLVSDACDALSVYCESADCLRDAARFVISRRS